MSIEISPEEQIKETMKLIKEKERTESPVNSARSRVMSSPRVQLRVMSGELQDDRKTMTLQPGERATSIFSQNDILRKG